ncbi:MULTISPECIES: hypothetical protein [unclassified Winogradskyella]|uniref:hypothetical protein n=1 Tax=unclassified Winogradskyella TaxID=2615021 RepID=UPI0012F83DA4|nr:MULTISPECIES: hypothetical protein [unclassified Winogradskyella]
MKALKISLLLVVVVVLTVSVISKDAVVQDDINTYKEYTPNKLVLDKKKRKVSTVS